MVSPFEDSVDDGLKRLYGVAPTSDTNTTGHRAAPPCGTQLELDPRSAPAIPPEPGRWIRGRVNFRASGAARHGRIPPERPCRSRSTPVRCAVRNDRHDLGGAAGRSLLASSRRARKISRMIPIPRIAARPKRMNGEPPSLSSETAALRTTPKPNPKARPVIRLRIELPSTSHGRILQGLQICTLPSSQHVLSALPHVPTTQEMHPVLITAQADTQPVQVTALRAHCTWSFDLHAELSCMFVPAHPPQGSEERVVIAPSGTGSEIFPPAATAKVDTPPDSGFISNSSAPEAFRSPASSVTYVSRWAELRAIATVLLEVPSPYNFEEKTARTPSPGTTTPSPISVDPALDNSIKRLGAASSSRMVTSPPASRSTAPSGAMPCHSSEVSASSNSS